MSRARLALVRSRPLAAGAGEEGETASVGDLELAERLATGDRAALAAVYERHAAALFGVLLRLLSRTGEAEDVLQETFVVAFQKAPQLRDKNALRPWLFRIAMREAHARLKKRRRWSFFGLAGSGSGEEADDARLASLVAESAGGDTRAELALLDRELAKLPAEQRIAWMLRHVEGEALEDVADACGCSLATAKRWVAAADQAVRRYVHVDEVENV